MSRPVRTISPTGMYHIIVQGLRDIVLFRCGEDYRFFIEQLRLVTQEFSVYAFCLLPEEVQLFVQENRAGEVPGMMRRLLTRYAGWYNRKYHRKGSVTEGRYQCAPVAEGEEGALVRYIHQAPVKAELCGQFQDYLYSSYLEYPGGWVTVRQDWFPGGFEVFHRQEEEKDFTIRPSGKLTDRQVREQVDLFCREMGIDDWNLVSKEERDHFLRQLRERFSIGQLQFATGLSRGVIARCTQREQSPSVNREMESFLL